MKKLTQYFLKGLLVLIPLVATIYVFFIIFVKIDSLFRFEIPGLGFAMTIITIVFAGFVASNFLTGRLIRYVDNIFTRLPLVKMIYVSIKDLINAFVGDGKSFNKPVLVAIFPGSNVQVMGFITRESLVNLGLNESVAVYLPQSYNFAGNLLIVPRDQVRPLDMDSGSVMAFIVSGGVTAKHTI